MAESKNPQEMWRLLKDLSEPKKERELLEIIRNDGTILSDKKIYFTPRSPIFPNLKILVKNITPRLAVV